MHTIQQSILAKLVTKNEARFTDIRPDNIEANLYSYHLSVLKRQGYLSKRGAVYELSPKGLSLIEDLKADTSSAIHQPRLLTMFVLLNERNEVYLIPRNTQPFIGSWNLPSGNIFREDASLSASSSRHLKDVLSLQDAAVARVGEAVIRVKMADELVSSVFVHVFAGRISIDDIPSEAGGAWTTSLTRQQIRLSPAISEIIDTIRSSQHIPFFEEYDVDWS
jgi:ADP-ribose pyrophosphatase YjhB (NUDIX family)